MAVRRVVLIVGPPGSGKSTLAASLGLTHLEREQYPTDAAFKNDVRRKANAPDATLAVVRCCPTRTEQAEWERLIDSTETIVLDVDPHECARRVHARKRKGWRGEVMAAKEWHSRRLEPAEPLTSSSRRWL